MNRRLSTILILGLFGASTLVHASLPPIKPGVPGKKRGDIIAPMLDEQIAAWCDFNKQIVVTRTNILCAYVGTKTTYSGTNSHKLPRKKLAKAAPKDLTPNFYEMSEYDNA